MSRNLALVLHMLLVCCSGWAQAGAMLGNGGPGPIKGQHVTVEMVGAGPAIAKGSRQTVGFVFSMEQGWHVSWRNPGPTGQPPHVEWTLPKGVTAGALQFPAPDRMLLQDAVDYGYGDATAYPVSLSAGQAAKADKKESVHLRARLHWVACKETCVPGEAELGLDLKLVPVGTPVSHEGEAVGALGSALKQMPKSPPAGSSFKAESSGKDLLLTATLGKAPADAEFYPLDPHTIADGPEQPIDLLDDGVQLHLELPAGTKAVPKRLRGLLKLTAEETYEVDVPVVRVVAPPAKSEDAAGGVRGIRPAVWVSVLVLLGAFFLWIRGRKPA